jgi:hypothetical protein
MDNVLAVHCSRLVVADPVFWVFLLLQHLIDLLSVNAITLGSARAVDCTFFHIFADFFRGVAKFLGSLTQIFPKIGNRLVE